MLPKIKNVLYASDMGNGSRPAFRTALSLCSDEDSEITFLSVIEPLSSTAQSYVATVISDEKLKELHDNGLATLKSNIAKRIQGFFDDEMADQSLLEPNKIKVKIEEGVIWQTILDVADKIEADIIVMGCRTHTTLGQKLLGSTANKVMYHSHRPVLIVPLGK